MIACLSCCAFKGEKHKSVEHTLLTHIPPPSDLLRFDSTQSSSFEVHARCGQSGLIMLRSGTLMAVDADQRRTAIVERDSGEE